MVELKENGNIIHNDLKVGHVDWSENVLVDIFIEEEHRGKGIGTEAASQFTEYVRRERYDIVKTTTVVSSSMETVLRRNGLDNDAVPLNGVSDDILEMANHRNEIQWYKEF